MLGSLSTIGYSSQYSTSQLTDVLMVNKQALIVDTRFKPWCSWSDRWRRPDLEQTYGNRYIWKGDVLGNINYHRPDQSIQIVNEAVGYPWILQRLEEGTTIILLCRCAHYETCHRKVIYDNIKALLGDRLPLFTLGQRVMTPDGVGVIDPDVPLDVQVQRNRYSVMHDVWRQIRYYYPAQLKPYNPEQLTLLATTANPYQRGQNIWKQTSVLHTHSLFSTNSVNSASNEKGQ